MWLEEAPNSWRIVRLLFLRMLDAASVMSKWYAACTIRRLHLVERWGLGARLWWTSIYADEKTEDMRTKIGGFKLQFKKRFKILGYIFNPAEDCKKVMVQGCRMQTKSIVERREDLKRAKMYCGEQCRIMVDQFYSVFFFVRVRGGFGVERFWTELKVGRKAMRRLCRFKKKGRNIERVFCEGS